MEPASSTAPLATRQDATFITRAGLANASCYSFESVNQTGEYLRHWDFRARLDQNDNTAAFRNDATFCTRPGLTGTGASLESFNYPGRYLRHQDNAVRVDQYQPAGTFTADATFTLTTPLA